MSQLIKGDFLKCKQEEFPKDYKECKVDEKRKVEEPLNDAIH